MSFAAPSSLRSARQPALVSRGDSIDAVFNLDGKPLSVAFTAGSLVGTGGREDDRRRKPRAASDHGRPLRSRRRPHVLSGPVRRRAPRDRGRGRAHRRERPPEDAGCRGAAGGAAGAGGAHVALAYLSSRQTSEGWVSEAWLAVDDGAPLRLSEDGSGATALALASRGASLLALTIDARSALTAMHVRPIAYEQHATLGEDVVVFVGGPGDRRTAAELAVPAAGPAVAMLPIARDMSDFGLALVEIDDPPHVDEPVVWSMYENGLDPAPVAATITGGDAGGRAWVARVRPQSREPRAPQVLELGELTGRDRTAVAVRAPVATTAAVAHVDLAHDAVSALWVTWLDASGSWLERLACK